MSVVIKLNDSFVYGEQGTDPLLTNGSLLLLEPALDSIDNVGNTLNNYAEVSAARLGVTAPTVSLTNNLSASGGVLKKTSKGGLHGIPAEGTLSSDDKAQIFAPEVTKYMSDNSSHDYALIATIKMTRDVGLDPSVSPDKSYHMLGSHPLGIYIRQLVKTGELSNIPASTDASSLGSSMATNSGGAVTIGVARETVGVSSTGLFGSWGWTSLYADDTPAYILYRLYLEDLTVSGRTFDEVYRAEQAITKPKFLVGGMYADDE